MDGSPFLALSYLSASAILMNACAILQNGTNVRYNLAVTQLRDFRTSLSTKDGRLSLLYSDTSAVLALAKKRVTVLLRGLGLIYVAIGLFGLTTFIGLVAAILPQEHSRLFATLKYVMIGTGGSGIFFLLFAVVTFMMERMVAQAMLRLHLQSSDLDSGPPKDKL